MKVQLKNGRIMDAHIDESGLVIVHLASGKTKAYNMDDIKVIEDTPVIEESATKESNKMEIFHYLREMEANGERIIMRYVTNVLDDKIAPAYNESVTTRRPVNGVLALFTGAYRFDLLEEMLCNNGVPFTLMVVSNKDLANFHNTKVREWIDKSVFAHANASYSFFLKVHAPAEWGIGLLGLSVNFKKKSAKRLQELYRLSEMSLHLTGDDYFDMAIMDMDDEPAEFYDGKSYMTQKMAVRVARGCQHKARRGKLISDIKNGKLVQVTLRIITPNGLVKGDCIIVPNDQISHDIIIHPENMKSEMVSDDYIHITMWEHSPFHMAVWDDQSTGNFERALPESKHIADIDRLVNNLRTSLDGGELPKWLLIGEKDRNEDGVPMMDQLSDSINRQWVRWQAHNLDIRSAQNMTFMGLGGVIKRMDTEKVRVGGVDYHKKMWVPMSNAALLTVVTRESAENLGGFVFDAPKSHCFYDERVGFVLPGKRFKDTFDLHGTWDQDDSAKVIKVKVWASRDYTPWIPVVDDEVILPNKAENAIEMGLVVRSPNGPGEYSLELVDNFDFIPEELRDEDQVVVVDICTMPLPQPKLLEKVEITGLPSSIEYSGAPITRDDAMLMVQSQMINPGVGRFANAMMVWANVMGPSFPKSMVDVMGEIVDASQQGIDPAAFAAIEDEPGAIFEMMIHEMEANASLAVDMALAATRMPASIRAEIPTRMVKGRFTRVQSHYRGAIQTIITELRNRTLQWRKETNLVQSLRTISFGGDMAEWSREFYVKYSTLMAAVDGKFKVTKDMDPFAKMNTQQAHKIAMEAVVGLMVADLLKFEDDAERARRAVGLYKWIVLFNHGKDSPHGKMDRIIFQGGGLGKLSVMDVLIEGIQHYGLVGVC